MSSSSDSVHRPALHVPPTIVAAATESTNTVVHPEGRRNSKYDIYGTATKPFGESYRRSLVVQDQRSDYDRGDSPVDTDSVEEAMGCSESKTVVALNEETVDGSFISNHVKPPKPITPEIRVIDRNADITEAATKRVNNRSYSTTVEGLNNYDIIYGTDNKTETDSGYSTTDIYSEVKKPEKNEENTYQTITESPRDKLMQQIRDRKVNNNVTEEHAYSTINKADKVCKEEDIIKRKSDDRDETTMTGVKSQEDKKINTVVTSAPISFVEEEYSYEPEKKEATSKLVVRSRSLINLDQNQFNYNSTLSCTLKRPNALKITTKPDGSIRYGLKNGSSESDLLDGDLGEPKTQASEFKNNYVSSIKNAFDAEIEKQSQNKNEKAEAFDGLRQYFHDNKRGLQELLINNNVVIIEPFRHEPPRSPSEKSDGGSQRTCRITGATIKSPTSEQNKAIINSNTLPRRHLKSRQNLRQGFYHPIKVNKELIDAELPDPDKVKSARELFEKVFKSKSTTEMPTKTSPGKTFFNTISGKFKITPEVKVIQSGNQTTTIDKRRQGRFMIEHIMKEEAKRYPLHRRWTDSGSLSSGVSSDFSCDQDFEFHQEGLNSGSNQNVLEEYSSDEEDEEYIYPYDDDERHPISPEVLNKIRACGTTVTYYGGKVISMSRSQFRSPMTMTIMDEIRQGGGTTEGRKKFESDPQESSLGVKFRLVKSNSCGSRLEIAGTEEDCSAKLVSPVHESFRGKSIAEEVTDVNEEEDQNRPEVEIDSAKTLEEDDEEKAEADRYVTNVEINETKNPQVMTWAELKLKEARKLWHCAPEAVRMPHQDMEFETFEVIDDSKPHLAEKNATGRG